MRPLKTCYRSQIITFPPLLIIQTVYCIVLMSVTAQLNFSTGWGKRGEELQIKTDGTHSSGIKLSIEQLTQMDRLLKIDKQ
ncbi:uncharacterized protein LOC117172190 isoform X2 [Belonocnema kinseyi]|uniref:uncharacterized protein LOC117172190 isoform X2 n=1 Tax=Belonocnema kinseyi TaxID=2817044 RepID=UPI00143DF656|nr:uncharacterized protein LOC117172190 isoform X2 [Belonocnema kinseyi]